MGLSALLLLANDVDFELVFRGWKRAAPLLDVPLVKTTTNPFTGQSIIIRSRRNPASAMADSDAVEAPALNRLLQTDIPGTGITDIAALAELLLVCNYESALDEILAREVRGPVDSDQVVWELPELFVRRLSGINESDSERLGKLWAAKYAADAASIEDEGPQAHELAIPESLWVKRLQAMAETAREAMRVEARTYFWMSC